MCLHQGLSSKVRPLPGSCQSELKQIPFLVTDNLRDDNVHVLRGSSVPGVGYPSCVK